MNNKLVHTWLLAVISLTFLGMSFGGTPEPLAVSNAEFIDSMPDDLKPSEVKAKIKGPAESLAGSLIFLSHEDATGDNKVWIIPEELKQNSASCGSSIFFAIPTPGEYRFGLIVANKQADIDYCWHTVKVNSLTPPTPTPVPPPTPGPGTPPVPIPVPPPSDTEGIRLTSRTAVDTLQDPTTTQSLSTALQELLPKLSPDFATAKAQTSNVIETVFALRQPASRSKDWLNIWRIPVNKSIESYNPQDTNSYRECLKGVIRGLCVNGTCPRI